MAFTQCCKPEKPFPHTDQLLNHIVDCVAARRPQTLYAEYPISSVAYEPGFRKITYAKLANAINVVAWWLNGTLGPTESFETLAYIGRNDLLYPALILGAVKVGYKILLLSPRNSVEAQLHLLRVTSCKTLLTPSSHPPAVAAILASENHGLHVLEVPSVESLSQPCRHFPYTKSLEDARLSPLVVMHTSGSTGLPKPITWTQAFPAAFAKQLQLDPPPYHVSVDQLYEGNRAFTMFPPFHAGYIAHVLVNAITNQTAFIFPISTAIPSAQSLSEVLKYTKADVAFVVPSIVEEMSKSSELLDHISANLDTLIYTGGDVPPACGDIVAAKIPIVNFYGTTEGAGIAMVRPEKFQPEDWKYLSFHPTSGAQFRHFAEDVYELYIVRQPGLERHQQIFDTFPNLQEFRTHDLFTKHPSKSDLNLWSHCGRADDIVVFSTGEKVNPVSLEQFIFARHPEISGIIVAGSQRLQAALLLELAEKCRDCLDDTTKTIEKIWPSVEEANSSLPSHAKIMRSHILFTFPHRPMSRSSKGTIQRAATLAEYAKELDTLYQTADNVVSPSKPRPDLAIRDTGALSSYIKRSIFEATGLEMTDNDNFFVHGMDSLQALQLTRDWKHAFGDPGLTVGTVYKSPSVALLSKTMQARTETSEAPCLASQQDRLRDINTLLTKYQSLVDRITPKDHAPAENNTRIVLLTGSTGAVGSYLLHTLLASPVNHVYCINRASNGHDRQIERCERLGLTIQFPTDRVTFIAGELSKAQFGLEANVYSGLLESVTEIVHNAWPVNFNHPLSSFEPQIEGVVNLVKFAASASRSPQLLYISSVSAVSSLRSDSVPEEVVRDSSAPAEMGYGESKYVAEQILDHAARKLSLRIDVARVGQIAGPIASSGEWNRLEWFPSLIRSSFHLAAIPSSLGADLDIIDWIPIDILVQILVDLVGLSDDISRGPRGKPPPGYTNVCNLINLHPVQWKSLLPTIVATLSSISTKKGRDPIKTDDFGHWLRIVQEDVEARNDASLAENGGVEALLERNPAFKFFRFYEKASTQRASNWDTQKAEGRSKALRELDGIREEWMVKWVKSWLR